MEDAFAKTSEEVLTHFNVSAKTGLSEEQIKRNRQKYGLNGNVVMIKNMFLCGVMAEGIVSEVM